MQYGMGWDGMEWDKMGWDGMKNERNINRKEERKGVRKERNNQCS